MSTDRRSRDQINEEIIKKLAFYRYDLTHSEIKDAEIEKYAHTAKPKRLQEIEGWMKDDKKGLWSVGDTEHPVRKLPDRYTFKDGWVLYDHIERGKAPYSSVKNRKKYLNHNHNVFLDNITIYYQLRKNKGKKGKVVLFNEKNRRWRKLVFYRLTLEPRKAFEIIMKLNEIWPGVTTDYEKYVLSLPSKKGPLNKLTKALSKIEELRKEVNPNSRSVNWTNLDQAYKSLNIIEKELLKLKGDKKKESS